MKITHIEIENFRLLKEIDLSVAEKSTVIVGRNNSGKTSLTEIFRRFFSEGKAKLKLEDFSISATDKFKEALDLKVAGADKSVIREALPEVSLSLTIDYTDNKEAYGILGNFIIDLDEPTVHAKIQISYKLKDGKIDAFFEQLSETEGTPRYYELIQEKISMYFETEVRAIDPTDDTNSIVIDRSKLTHLIGVDFINAQRGLDDETHNERDILGKILGSIFKNSASENAPDDMKVKTEALKTAIQEIQEKVDTDVTEKINELLPALQTFGYPGLSDPNITTKTTFEAQTIVDDNTKILYNRGNNITLPETYNGLGSRNLIYILFKLFEFFRRFQSSTTLFKSHLIFIEEPEAHLHPQMQEVFINKLYEIAESFSNEMNGGAMWPVQFIVSTHSTHIANEAKFDSIRYFHTKNESERQETVVKDLNLVFTKEEDNIEKEFIHKYLTLTKCDLFFADKAIFVEGTTERILLPKFIEKIVDVDLKSQFISTVEIGGAYAHLFYNFLDFLELKTLIITDLDSTKNNGEGKFIKCPVHQGERSSNAGVKKWFEDSEDPDAIVELNSIQSKNDDEKVVKARRIAYQTSEGDKDACGRSFEDAFMIANPTLFGITGENKNEVELNAYTEAEGLSNGKANFAIEYAVDKTDWSVPKYISDGLIWLASNEIETKDEEDEQ